MTRQRKQLIAGILLGIIVPIIGSVILKEVLGNFSKFSYFQAFSWEDIAKSNPMISTFIQFGVLLNLIVFFILKWKKQLQIQTGLVLPTMIYIFTAMLLKFYF